MNIHSQLPSLAQPLQEVQINQQTAQTTIEQEIVQHAKDSAIDKLCLSCEKAIREKKLTFSTLGQLLSPYKDNKQIQAILTSLDTCSLLQKQNTQLDVLEIFKTCLYIETKLTGWQSQNETILETTTALLLLHYDPKTKSVFIHLDSKKGKRIGKGESKTWTQSICYQQNQITSVAYTTLKGKKSKQEIAILNKLHGQKGIAKTYTITPLAQKPNTPAQTGVIQKYYNGGSLDTYLIGNKSLTENQKKKVVLDLLQGLSSMHASGVRHNDFHMEQCLLELQSGNVTEACVTDFDKAEFFTAQSKMQEKDFFLFEIDSEEDEENELTDEELRTLTRLKQEQTLPKQNNINITHVRDDLYQMAALLNQLFFDGSYNLDTLDTQSKRLAFDDKMKTQNITFKDLAKNEQIEYVMLKLVAFSDQQAISAEDAHKLLTTSFS